MQVKGFKSSRRFWLSFVVFLGLLAFFYSTYHYYLTPMLAIRTDGHDKPSLKVYWDSGSGFNENEVREYLLYAGNNEFADLPLARDKIIALKLVPHNLKINKLGLYDWRKLGKIDTLPVFEKNGAYFVNYNIGVPGTSLLTLPLQVVFAALLALVFYVLISRINALNRANSLSALKAAFFGKRRWFWWIFATLSCWWLTWLFAEWPGIMTRDSYYFTWREITSHAFEGITPVTYNLLVLALTQIYNSPAIVSIVQILCMAGLSAHIFYFCIKRSVNKIVLVLFGALLFLSIPVASYNLLLVKDLPYSLLMLFWAYFVFLLYLNNKNGTATFANNAEIVLMGALLALLALVRHNGLMYIVLIPLLLLIFRLLPRRQWLIFTVVAVLVFAGCSFLTRNLQTVSPESVELFFKQSALVSPTYAAAVKGKDISADEKQALAKVMPFAEIQKKYTPTPRPDNYRNLTIGIMQQSAEDFSDYNKTSWNLIKRHPWLVLEDRSLMFAGALGLSNNVYIFADETQLHQGYVYWRCLEANKFDKPAASFGKTAQLYNNLINMATTTPWSYWIFNTVPALLILLWPLFSWRKQRASALFALVILINVPVLFAIMSTCEWRFYYFIYLAGFFAVPLYLAERKMFIDKKQVNILEG
ncbi:MAG: DUF6020 family protein [Negativicutes bacterium]|jgi:hypothetical protein